MASKPFFSFQETQDKLGLGEDQIRALVSEGRLKEFRSQGQLHFKADEVERIAGEMGMGTLGISESPREEVDAGSFGTGMGSAEIGLSESVGFANPEDLGLSESVGFSMPADEGKPAATPGSDNIAGISGSQTGLGSADLGLSESVGFSAGLSDSDSDSDSNPGTPIQQAAANIPPPPPSGNADPMQLSGGELGLSESVGFSQLDEDSEEIPAPRYGTAASLSDDLDNLGLTENLGMAQNEPRIPTRRVDEDSSDVPDKLGLSDDIGLDEADAAIMGAAKDKDDTVITSAGISVFDDDDLQVEADEKAATAVAPAVSQGDISLASVGSGSGLLDLTAEQDAGLDPMLLDDMLPQVGAGMPGSDQGIMAGSGFMAQGMTGYIAAPPQIITEYIEEVEAPDPYETMFSLLLVVPVIMLICVGIIWTGVLQGATVSSLSASLLDAKMEILAVGGALTLIFLIVGFLLGSSKKKQMALAAAAAAYQQQRAGV